MKPFILYDTEFTAWPGSQESNWGNEGEHKEIIQLAAIKVAYEDNELRLLSSFNVLVKPTINPQLSDYIKSLTGIEQSIVDDHGVDFESCAQQFFEFNDRGRIRCIAWGTDEEVLQINYGINHLNWDYPKSTFADLKRMMFEYGLDYRHKNSGSLAEMIGVKLDGHVHNALYDVKSMCVFLNDMIQSEKIPIGFLKAD